MKVGAAGAIVANAVIQVDMATGDGPGNGHLRTAAPLVDVMATAHR
jgi:hypothetical protein